jgi:hypothetical protein
MTRLTSILTILILTFSCTDNQRSNSTQGETSAEIDSAAISSKTLLEEFAEDTILERNNPNSLDLSKNQVFIDTTRSSKFYESIKNWSASKFAEQEISSILNTINKNFQPKQVDLKDFPSRFITLRELNKEFVLYDRCDGIDRRFEIRDTAFIIYGPLESNAESISKLILLSDKSVELELRTYHAKSNRLRIDKIDGFIYKLVYDDEVQYLTTIDRIGKFDLVVNNCPIIKMVEFDGFDEE